MLPPAAVAALQQHLVSKDPAEVATVLATGIRDAYLAQPTPLLPPGSSLIVDGSELRVMGELGAVPVTVSGPSPGTWTLLLTHEGDSWLVYGTAPA